MASPILWPQPKRIVYGPVVDYGYENEILLPIDIDVPATLTPTANVVIEAKVSWLVCSDTCIPEDAQLNIAVPVGVDTESDPRWAEGFARVRSQLPVPNPFPTTASINGENITLHIAMGDAEKLHEVMFFPEDRSVVDDDAPQRSAVGSAGLTLTLKRSNKAKPLPAALRGCSPFAIRPRNRMLALKQSRSQAPSDLTRRLHRSSADLSGR
jgi:DsbC/DsbD-like thiol-disulfide interchange protein